MGLGLGLDVGGTQCRWALADAQGQVLAQGVAGSFNGQQVHSESGRRHIAGELALIARALQPRWPQEPLNLWAGVTGYDGGANAQLTSLFAKAFSGADLQLSLYNDVELTHRVSLEPGEGYLVYSGTGCIATYVDEFGHLHRVGGRGETLGDDGSGYWIGCQALRLIWRCEDDSPGFLQDSLLAQALFERIGGANWDQTRRYMELSSRGEVGRLAIAVAAVAQRDPLARDLLQRAGQELARLARLLINRHGPRPVWVTGRASMLHPLLENAFEQALPAGTVVRRTTPLVQVEAALKAAREPVRDA